MGDEFLQCRSQAIKTFRLHNISLFCVFLKPVAYSETKLKQNTETAYKTVDASDARIIHSRLC